MRARGAAEVAMTQTMTSARRDAWPPWCIPLSDRERIAVPLADAGRVCVERLTGEMLTSLAAAAYRVENRAGVFFACGNAAPLECSEDDWARVSTGDAGVAQVRRALQYVASHSSSDASGAVARLARAYAGPLPNHRETDATWATIQSQPIQNPCRSGFLVMCLVSATRYGTDKPVPVSAAGQHPLLTYALRTLGDARACDIEQTVALDAAERYDPACAQATAAQLVVDNVASVMFADKWHGLYSFAVPFADYRVFVDAVRNAQARERPHMLDMYGCVLRAVAWARMQSAVDRVAFLERARAECGVMARVGLGSDVARHAFARKIIELALAANTGKSDAANDVWGGLVAYTESLIGSPVAEKRPMQCAPVAQDNALSPSGKRVHTMDTATKSGVIDVSDDGVVTRDPAARMHDARASVLALLDPYVVATTELTQLQERKNELAAELASIDSKIDAANNSAADIVNTGVAGAVGDLLRESLERDGAVYDYTHAACGIAGIDGPEVDAVRTLVLSANPSMHAAGMQALGELLSGDTRGRVAGRIVAGCVDARAASEWARQLAALHLAFYLATSDAAGQPTTIPAVSRDIVGVLLASCERARRGDPPPDA